MADTVAVAAAAPSGVLDFSPVRRDAADKEKDVPLLSLVQFSKAPFVSFGTAKVGTSKSAVLRVENPAEDTEAEVTVEKIPSGKGFSVETRVFTVQPEGAFSLSVTWTPTEEGGIRELLVFSANGVLKHQAVLLGRAEAPKKKKKSLWDSIKNKRGGENVVAPRRKKSGPPLKMAANKTFQVSREPQYKRDKRRSPLAALNEGGAVRERSLTKQSPSSASEQQQQQQQRDQENVPQSPVRLVPAGAERKVLNRTLSPIGTPESFRKLMPRIRSETPPCPAVRCPDEDDSVLSRASVLSVKDALVLIGSDLSGANASPRDSSSTCSFSDSLESKSERPDVPERLESDEPRLTFCVGKKAAASGAASSEDEKLPEKAKKASFTSATVTKGRAPTEAGGSGGRKVKKSRRRLLEKTLELQDGSGQSGSGPGTPGLPVIDSDSGPSTASLSPSPSLGDSPGPVAFPMSSPPHFSFSVASPLPVSSSSPLHKVPPETHVLRETSASTAVQDDLFPIQLAANSKKRKSEEFLRRDGKPEDAGKSERVKRTRTVAVRAAETRGTSQRQKPAGSVRSVQARGSVVPAQAKPARSRVASRGSASVNKSKVAAVAQARLNFILPTQTALPRHPTPFAAKNMFYDERWIEKQERGFTWWLNHVLTPDDFKVNTEVTKVSAVSLAVGGDDAPSVPKAPTKEEMSFSTYTARRKLNRLRRSACRLFTSDAMVKAVQRLELEVEARRLLVRKDRHLWKDIGERRKVLDWLLSYNPLWLRIGLETIFGELISLESNSDALGLAMFILQRLLWNPDIAAEFRHPRVPHLYKDGHEEALSRFTLKKLLLLVCFLDRAKESRLIEHDPCLFCVDAEFKASKDLLLAFSRDFLSGEGILPRHLGYLGLPVSHVQKPLDEFGFAVKNLAVDLKCGIRLVRVMELLVQDWTLSAKLRLPAISRLQKVHNVDVALQVLKSKGVDLKDERGAAIDSRDIVDGHRERTLSLLWKIIFAFHVEVILDEEQLRDEIGFLKETLRTKRTLASLRADRGLRPGPAETRAPYRHGSAKIALLMDWVRAVCDFYSLKAENFTVTFSDGRVLCHLIHHYHPGLLPAAAIGHSTTQTVDCSPRGRLELDCSAGDSDSSYDSPPTGPDGPDSPSLEFKKLLDNEKSNFRLVNTAVAFLGGVPAMINPADMSNTIPNEKVVMSYLSFLCARLLNLRNETRAARVIQDAWRKFRLKKHLQLYKERNAAAQTIQVMVRRFLQRRRAERQSRAAVLIQALWRGHAARHRLRLERAARVRARRHEAATLIQAQWRMFSAMRAYQRLQYHAIVVQAQWRMRRAAAAYGRLRRAASVVQERWRARALSGRDRRRFLTLRAAATKLQRGYRRWKARKTLEENRAAAVIQAAFKKWRGKKTAERRAAAVKIQAWFRTRVCLRRYRRMKTAAVLLQALYRGHAQRRRFQKTKLQHRAAAVIQAAFRRHAARRRYRALRGAAAAIQRKFRATLLARRTRKEYEAVRNAAVVLQASWRGRAARKRLNRRSECATAIQACYRRHRAQTDYRAKRLAAVVLQRRYRSFAAGRATRNAYLQRKAACVAIQAAFRGAAVRTALKRKHRAATVIQASVRMFLTRKDYRLLQSAAIVTQSRYRAVLLRRTQQREYRRLRRAAVTIQAAFRGARARRRLRRRHDAATAIQAQFRMHRTRTAFLATKCAVVIVQERYRAKVLRDQQVHAYRSTKRAAVVIQAAYRGRRARRELAAAHRAAVTIQGHFRMYRQRTQFVRLRWAASVLQARFRATKKMRAEVHALSAKRNAAAVLQAAFRGMKCRRALRRRRAAAGVIQRAYRARRQRRRYLAVRSATLVVQRRYRANVEAKTQKKAYEQIRAAAVVLQSAYRGQQVRKDVACRHRAATAIQAAFRKHREEVKFQAMRLSAIIIQRRYRARLHQRTDRETFLRMRSAAVVLQAAYRGMKSRRSVQQMQDAARVLQRAYRARSDHRRYLTMKRSVLVIQRRYRCTGVAKTQRAQYLEMRRAAVVLQSAYRGQQVRKDVARQHRAATLIQAAFRKHREEVKFQAMRLSAIIIQRRYRARLHQRTDRDTFLRTRSAAVVLQAAFRGRLVRNHLANMHRAAAVLQANFRKRKQQRIFRRQRWAACVLQQRFRAQKQRNQEIKRYRELRRAAVVLQSAYRGQQVRKDVARRRWAATAIQAAFRKHREEVKFQAMRLSAIIIQRRYRARLHQRTDRDTFLRMRRAAVVLQAAYRGMKSRRSVQQMQDAARVLQRAYRARSDRRRYLTMKRSVLLIQRRYRCTVAARAEKAQYLEIRRAAVILQSAYRGQQVRKDVARQHRAATLIQAAFRKHREEVKFQAMRLSAIIIQRRYRARVLQKRDRASFLRMRRAAVVLQAAYRGMKSRRSVQQMQDAARVLQRAYRARSDRRRYLTTKRSVLLIQRRYRCIVAARAEKAQYLEMRRAAVVLQAAFRGRLVRNHVANMHRAAAVLQANFRRRKQQRIFRRQRWAACVLQQRFRAQKQRNQEIKRYRELRRAVVVLQAAYRGMKSRRSVEQMQDAARVLQRAYRARSDRRRYLTTKRSVLVIQRRYRCTVAARAERAQYLELRQAAVILQSAYRGQQVRKDVARRHRAATLIQAAFRKHREEVKFQAMRLSAIIIQRRYRARLHQRTDRDTFLRMRSAAVVLQAAFRGRRVRRDVGRRRRAAVAIQACWRRSAQRRRFLRTRAAAVVLQRRLRAVRLGRAARTRLARERRAAVTLQRSCRAWISRRQAEEAARAERRRRFASAVFHHLSAVRIQRAFRAHRALESARRQVHCVVALQRWVRAGQQRRRYLEDRRKVVTAQRAVRRWLDRRHQAAGVIQRAVRMFLALRRQRRLQQGIVKAQALWRGHRSRQLNDNPKLVKLRHRLRLVSADAREEDKLCNKTASALDYLLRYKHFSYILEALKNLEIATRLSPECCERLVESGATTTIVTLIRCCNRSVPCMDVITLSIQVLLNLSKYHKTIAVVFSVENSVETLLDLLQRYREKAGDKVAEKGGSIFTKACFLLALLLQDKGRTQEVLKMPKVLERIRSIYRLTARKHKMDAERTVIRQKMNASVNGSFYVAATPRKSRPAPKFAPDWVLTRHKLQDVVDPLRAIHMVAEALAIAL